MANSGGKQEGKFDKIKQKIFGKSSVKGTGSSSTSSTKAANEIIITHDLLKEISPESPANNRLKTIKELCDIVLTKKLEKYAVEALWTTIKDLIQPEHSTENRHIALKFLHCLIQGQYSDLGQLRHYFFLVIKEHNVPDDLIWRLEIFKSLTDSGKDLTYLEEETGWGDLLIILIPEVIKSATYIQEFLEIFLNVVKYNAAYVDEDVMVDLIKYVCVIASMTKSEDQLEMCIKVLDTVICYSYLPSAGLYDFVECLCKTVSIQQYCEMSWQLMRKLLGTHLGHSGIFTMSKIMQDRDKDHIVLRGAVFFVGMALWGSRKVQSLKHTPCSVLPSFLKALECNHSIVAYEVVLSVHRLVNKYGKDLQLMTWDSLIDILEVLLEHVELVPTNDQSVGQFLHETFTTIESLYELGQFSGSTGRFFNIIEKCTNRRPESSVLMLIQYRAQNIHPSRSDWIQNLFLLIERYFKYEVRTKIRLKILDILSTVICTNRHGHEDDLIELVVLPHFNQIEKDPDNDIRTEAVQLLIDLIQGCNSHRCNDLLTCIEKLLKRQMMSPSISTIKTDNQEEVDIVRDESSLMDVKAAVSGLIAVFRTKLFKLPSTHACRIYQLIIDHMKMHYANGYLSETAISIRIKVLTCFLLLRANGAERIGSQQEGDAKAIHFSPFIYCAHRHSNDEFNKSHSRGVSPNTISDAFMTLHATVVPFSETFSVYLNCLDKEKDWRILEVLFKLLPDQLKNKALILSVGSELEDLCYKLCMMVSDRSVDPSKAYLSTPSPFSRSEYHGYIFPVLSTLATYCNLLGKSKQRDLVKCLEFGLVSKCAKVCVTTLTICLLEMSGAMRHQLPSLLNRLAQITATISMAAPMLEFLSNLTNIPMLYSNFVEEQYKKIFAIALPYTNPFKYDHYTVSLAYHVIAMWFLKCRLPLRKDLVKFINKGLHNNVLRQFQESNRSKSMQIQNDDTTDLTASGNNESLKKPARALSASDKQQALGEDTNINENEPLLQFHKELAETCIDTMARYTFSSCSSMPKRTPVAEFLLKDGQKQTWLVGSKLVTITTSGSDSQPGGLCEKCMSLCRKGGEGNNVSGENEESFKMKRRRHKSAAVSGSLTDTEPARVSSIDDLEWHRQSSIDKNSNTEDPTDGIFNLGIKKTISTFSPHICSCWCQGWAEIYIRRPTGNVAWIMKFENGQLQPTSGSEFPLADISTLFMPKFVNSEDETLHRIDSEKLLETEYDSLHEEYFPMTSSDTESISIQQTILVKDEENADVFDEVIDDSECPPVEFQGKSRLRRASSNPELSISPDTDNSQIDTLQPITTHVDKKVAHQSLVRLQHEHRKLKPQLSVDSAASILINDETNDDNDKFPVRKPRGYTLPTTVSTDSYIKTSAKDSGRNVFSPNFVFLQLYHSPYLSDKDKPILLPNDDDFRRSIKMLDLIPCYESHKIGVVYVGPGQAQNETEILSNKFGSVRYVEFLQGLGQIIQLSMVDREHVFLGGLDTEGSDGKFAFCWHDDITQVIFHVATLMPNKPSDPNCNAKKLHIGNDFVTIIYNESNEDYVPGTIKGQFNYVNIVIQPLDNESNAVTIKAKDEISSVVSGNDTKIISNESLSILARQMALHTNLASRITQQQLRNPNDPYASNWLERLRQIKRLHKKIVQEHFEKSDAAVIRQFSIPSRISGVEDFTSFV